MFFSLNNKTNQAKQQEYLYIIMVILTVFFTFSEFMLINFFLLFLFLSIIIVSKKGKLIIPKVSILLFFLILLIMFQMLFVPSEFFSLSVALKEFSRVSFYIMILLIISNIAISESLFMRVWQLIFFFLLIVSVFQYFNMFGINDILGAIYGYTPQLAVSSNYNTLEHFRAGSVFLNPNSYAKFILLFASVYLTIIIYKKNKIKSFFLFTLILLALVLAGSRTGLVIFVILVLLYALKKIKVDKLTYQKLFFILISFVFLIIIFLFILAQRNIDFSMLRTLDVIMGLDNSLGYKFETFINMLDNFGFYNVFIGLGPFINDIKHLTLIDFDIGYLITFYGSAGLLIYLLIILEIIKANKNKITNYKLLSVMLVTVFVLFGFTGGTFLNLRFFSVFILFSFINIKGVEKDEKEIKKINFK